MSRYLQTQALIAAGWSCTHFVVLLLTNKPFSAVMCFIGCLCGAAYAFLAMRQLAEQARKDEQWRQAMLDRAGVHLTVTGGGPVLVEDHGSKVA